MSDEELKELWDRLNQQQAMEFQRDLMRKAMIGDVHKPLEGALTKIEWDAPTE